MALENQPARALPKIGNQIRAAWSNLLHSGLKATFPQVGFQKIYHCLLSRPRVIAFDTYQFPGQPHQLGDVYGLGRLEGEVVFIHKFLVVSRASKPKRLALALIGIEVAVGNQPTH